MSQIEIKVGDRVRVRDTDFIKSYCATNGIPRERIQEGQVTSIDKGVVRIQFDRVYALMGYQNLKQYLEVIHESAD